MPEQTSNTNKQKKKFKQTRQLIRIALNDGMTQTEIAKACRTQQSIVSQWKSGVTQASEEQLSPLLAIFGSKLKRQSFKLYQKLEESNEFKYIQVNGEIIFSHTFFERTELLPSKKIVKNSLYKIIIHKKERNGFVGCFLEKAILPDSKPLESDDPDAVWFLSFIEDNLVDIKTWWKKVSTLLKDSADFNILENDLTIGEYLLRRALLQQRIPVDDVEMIG